jgi:hypothetical protein
MEWYSSQRGESSSAVLELQKPKAKHVLRIVQQAGSD